MYLPALTNEEFLRYAESTFNQFASTELELELVKRFAVLLEIQDGVTAEDDALAPLIDSVITDYATSAEFLKAVRESAIETPKELTAELALAEKFRDYCEEHSLAVCELNNLITATN